MKLDDRLQALIAVGASVASNCQSCLEYHAGKALKSGVSEEEIAEAIQVGKQVSQGAASTMEKLAAHWTQPTPFHATKGGCGCSA